MNQYRTAVIGLTGIGAAPLQDGPDPVLGPILPHSHVSAYEYLPRTNLVAVCDLAPAALERYRENWGAIQPEVHGYTDYREMLARESIDLLSVVTSDHRHAQIVVDAVEAGVKGIFCEKPVATTLADADRMIAACRSRGIPLLIDHSRRWFPEFVQARQLVRSGTIGPLRRIVATLGGPRAMLFRNGTHLVDTVCFFAESDPDWVMGELDDEQRDYPPRYAGDGGRDPSTDPGGSGYIHFRNGIRAFINASKNTMANFELDLLGENGRLRIGSHVAEVSRLCDSRANGVRDLAVSQIHAPRTVRGDMAAAIEELIGLIEKGGEGSSTGEDGRRTLSILLGILQSSAEGGTRLSFPIQDR